MDLELVTSGQSHGPGIVAIVSGMPAGLVVDRDRMQRDLARRQAGYGRSPRQKIEQDTADILGGMRHGKTLGGPISPLRARACWAGGPAAPRPPPVRRLASARAPPASARTVSGV